MNKEYVSGSSVSGLPRPSVELDGNRYPLPYITEDHPASVSETVVEKCFDCGLCQYCGLPIDEDLAYLPGTLYYYFDYVATPFANDGSLIHPKCLRVALAICPHLKAPTGGDHASYAEAITSKFDPTEDMFKTIVFLVVDTAIFSQISGPVTVRSPSHHRHSSLSPQYWKAVIDVVELADIGEHLKLKL